MSHQIMQNSAESKAHLESFARESSVQSHAEKLPLQRHDLRVFLVPIDLILIQC